MSDLHGYNHKFYIELPNNHYDETYVKFYEWINDKKVVQVLGDDSANYHVIVGTFYFMNVEDIFELKLIMPEIKCYAQISKKK